MRNLYLNQAKRPFSENDRSHARIFNAYMYNLAGVLKDARRCHEIAYYQERCCRFLKGLLCTITRLDSEHRLLAKNIPGFARVDYGHIYEEMTWI